MNVCFIMEKQLELIFVYEKRKFCSSVSLYQSPTCAILLTTPASKTHTEEVPFFSNSTFLNQYPYTILLQVLERSIYNKDLPRLVRTNWDFFPVRKFVTSIISKKYFLRIINLRLLTPVRIRRLQTSSRFHLSWKTRRKGVENKLKWIYTLRIK